MSFSDDIARLVAGAKRQQIIDICKELAALANAQTDAAGRESDSYEIVRHIGASRALLEYAGKLRRRMVENSAKEMEIKQ